MRVKFIFYDNPYGRSCPERFLQGSRMSVIDGGESKLGEIRGREMRGKWKLWLISVQPEDASLITLVRARARSGSDASTAERSRSPTSWRGLIVLFSFSSEVGVPGFICSYYHHRLLFIELCPLELLLWHRNQTSWLKRWLNESVGEHKGVVTLRHRFNPTLRRIRAPVRRFALCLG